MWEDERGEDAYDETGAADDDGGKRWVAHWWLWNTDMRAQVVIILDVVEGCY